MRKNMWLAPALVMILATMSFFVSCAKEAIQNQTAQSQTSDSADTDSRQAARQEEDRARTATEGNEAAGTAFTDEKIHFAFDSAVLSEEARRILADKADYLRANPVIRVTVEGHCDERGTDAYNMALGERRAEAVRDFLVNLGIGVNRFNTVSFGEERPIALGQDEASWAQNRRAQFVMD